MLDFTSGIFVIRYHTEGDMLHKPLLKPKILTLKNVWRCFGFSRAMLVRNRLTLATWLENSHNKHIDLIFRCQELFLSIVRTQFMKRSRRFNEYF